MATSMNFGGISTRVIQDHLKSSPYVPEISSWRAMFNNVSRIGIRFALDGLQYTAKVHLLDGSRAFGGHFVFDAVVNLSKMVIQLVLASLDLFLFQRVKDLLVGNEHVFALCF